MCVCVCVFGGGGVTVCWVLPHHSMQPLAVLVYLPILLLISATLVLRVTLAALLPCPFAPPPGHSGGPGFESPRPTEASGWLKVASSSFRIVLMDQRGTGRSSPITTNSLAQRGTPEQQAHYLSFFRWVDKDNIAMVCVFGWGCQQERYSMLQAC